MPSFSDTIEDLDDDGQIEYVLDLAARVKAVLIEIEPGAAVVFCEAVSTYRPWASRMMSRLEVKSPFPPVSVGTSAGLARLAGTPRYTLIMSGAVMFPRPEGPEAADALPRPNPGRIATTVVGWASIVLVPAAGVVAMLVDDKAGWLAFIYIIVLGPGQALAHVAIAVLLQIAYSKAPQRPVTPWLPLAYAVYLLAFVAASFLVLDVGDTPVYYSPWRRSAAAVVEPLLGLALCGFIALFVLVVVDLVRASKAQIVPIHSLPPTAPPR